LKKAQASANKQASPAINFKGKTVVITGAGAGLGRSYALMFGKLGANVVINDVTKEGAESVVKEVKQGGSYMAHAECNTDDQSEVKLSLPSALLKTAMLSSKLLSMLSAQSTF